MRLAFALLTAVDSRRAASPCSGHPLLVCVTKGKRYMRSNQVSGDSAGTSVRVLGAPCGGLAAWLKPLLFALAMVLLNTSALMASEADLAIPDLHKGHFDIFGKQISAFD